MIRGVLFWAAAALAAAVPVPTEASAGARDALVTASIAEPSNLIPMLAADTASAEVSRLIFSGLVKYDADLRLVGDLAESWEIEDGGLRIVFRLRRNVRWQDGHSFSAEDVLFTFRKIMDPDVPTPYSGNFEKVRDVSAPDPLTVVVRYRESFSPGLGSWTMGVLPKHLLEGENLAATDFARRPVGTGPYRLAVWRSGERLELEAFEGHFAGPPGIARLIFRILPDQATTFLELQTERIDWTTLTPLQYQKQSDGRFFKERYRKFRHPSFSYLYLGFNLEHPLFKELSVRRALGLAVDREELIRVVLLGLGRPATGPFLPGSWAFDPEVPVRSYDPGAARRLLEQAGWRDADGDGVLEKEGRRLSFTLLTNHGNDQRRMVAEILQRRFADVGVEMKIQVVEWGTFLKEFIDKKRFDAALLAWQLSPDPDLYDIFHSSKRRPGEFNFVGYQNAEVDRLLDEGRSHFGEEARAPIYRRIHRILAEEEPYLFLYVPDALSVLHRRFRNVEEGPVGIGHNLIEWTVDPSEVRYRFAEDRRSKS